MWVMRKTAAAPLSRRPFYQALAEVNLHFDQIREHLERLRHLTVLGGRSARAFFPAFEAAVSEAQAWFNTELLEAQGEIESREWARLDLLRARREKSFRNDRSPRRRPPPADAKGKRR